ncbi:hypothetical protein MiSe_27430 [Microseira wollei NIES-4236]|uniref:Uncharacterized protein n=1 Tax=Microseira wollei NIES-4236 TaxID=2530354 RepID=A0AAV3WH26_9CYAN|nr:hypothetical protein MiSe_27430 [Microseira wollei NIES-4236]
MHLAAKIEYSCSEIDKKEREADGKPSLSTLCFGL